jgi:RimJ/RimL family protein N-acetyltransferase
MNIELRRIKMKDVFSLSKMYLSLPENIKRYFHPFPFKTWLVLARFIHFSLSNTNTISRCLQKAVPKLVAISIVAIDVEKQIPAGFAFLQNLRKLSDSLSYDAKYLGIVVLKTYQNLGVGSKLMDELIQLAYTNNIRKITLTVIAENESAISLYQKFGFKMKNIVKNREFWNGKFYSDCDMELTSERIKGRLE